MHPHNAPPHDHPPAPTSSTRRQQKQRWLSVLYGIGLLLVFLISLLLLPADAGVGKLLWSGLADC